MVDFYVADKDRVVSLSEQGVITFVEGLRAIKQTGRLSEDEGFSCIAEIEEKIVATSYSSKHRINTFRLLGQDLRDLYQQAVDCEGRIR